MKNILILGGSGNFGKRIAFALAKAGIPIIISGRDSNKLQDLQRTIQKLYPTCSIKYSEIDVELDLADKLEKIKPSIAINTVGPFQTSNYDIATTCIKKNIHYIDLADGIDFVCGINTLDKLAKQHNVAAISGASTVPGLSSAVLEKYKDEFTKIESLTYGISPGQKAERGLATTKGILSYIGKPLKISGNNNNIRYGWQDIYQEEYPELGKRWMANCEIPDLNLFPSKYGIKKIHFSAGMESSALHLSIWAVSWLVRVGLISKLSNYAPLLLRASHLFDWLGTDGGGMHMIISGIDKENLSKEIKWFIIAKDGDGPQIPTIPAIILAKKLFYKKFTYQGACPCIGMISLDEYLEELKEFSVKVYKSVS